MSTQLATLSADELSTLSAYEGVIRQGLESFVEVGNALARIRDGRLYRAEFKTFEEYCGARWNLSRAYVHRLVAASDVVADICDDGGELLPTGNKPETERQARPLVNVPKEERAAVWKEVVETAPRDYDGKVKITAKHVEQVVAEKIGKPQPSPHVAHSSGNNEWYTPSYILDAARACLGGFDCDPASSEVANRQVKAKKFYSADECGISATKWGRRVWMNPPYAQPLCDQFCNSLIDRLGRGEVEEACVLVNNATETQWFGKLARSASAVVFLSGRVKFLDHTGQPKNTPLQGQAVLYFGDRFTSFLECFSTLGWGAIIQ